MASLTPIPIYLQPSRKARFCSVNVSRCWLISQIAPTAVKHSALQREPQKSPMQS